MSGIRQSLLPIAATVALSGSAGLICADEAVAATILSDSKGMTLYTYDKDVEGVPACYGLCAIFWPPAIAPADAVARDGYTLIRRSNGEMQWAYKGKPLYLYQNDRKPGDMSGDGAEQVWHVAIP